MTGITLSKISAVHLIWLIASGPQTWYISSFTCNWSCIFRHKSSKLFHQQVRSLKLDEIEMTKLYHEESERIKQIKEVKQDWDQSLIMTFWVFFTFLLHFSHPFLLELCFSVKQTVHFYRCCLRSSGQNFTSDYWL